MSKRVAEKQLTLENFEDEDREEEEEEDSSHPQIASDEVLKTRVIAKARRALNAASDSNDQKRTAFSGFSGFKGFGTNSVSNTSSIPSVNPFQSLSQPLNTSGFTSITQNKPLFATNGSKTTIDNNSVVDGDENYNNKLSELNKCFMSHVQTYMEKSKYYDFTQVCQEYIDYHKKIESELNQKKEDKPEKAENKLPSIESKPEVKSDANSLSSTPLNSSQFGFTSQSTIGTTSLSSQASIDQLSQPLTFTNESMFAKPAIQFSFGSKLSSNLNNNSNTAVTESAGDVTSNANDDDEHVPPKVESVKHEESDSVFSKRCKLYFKKGDQFVEKGLGHLFIKKEESSSNAQLLVRADTKLGNVLLNISLVESLPIIKADNNKGVLLTCIPNPPLDPKASSDIQTSVTFLLRVKTTEDSDELYNSLTKYKSASTL